MGADKLSLRKHIRCYLLRQRLRPCSALAFKTSTSKLQQISNHHTIQPLPTTQIVEKLSILFTRDRKAIMATPQILQTEQDLLMYASLFPEDENVRHWGLEIEKKIEYLESLAGNVRSRRSRRWLNDRLLLELVPRLNAEEIRGLFAPPPWGEEVPRSAFCMRNVGEWDGFRNIDMDKEVLSYSLHIKWGESFISQERTNFDISNSLLTYSRL